MSGDAFYLTTVKIPCPSCGKASEKPLREVSVNNFSLCFHCLTVIDIGSPEWRAKIDAAIASARKSHSPAAS